MCTYSYMGFGHSPTHRFSPFVDLTTFNRSGGVHGAFDDYGEEESTSTLPLFFFPFFLSFVERFCVLALCLGVIGIDTQKHGVQRVEDFCRLGRWLFGAFPHIFCMPSSCVFYLAFPVVGLVDVETQSEVAFPVVYA